MRAHRDCSPVPLVVLVALAMGTAAGARAQTTFPPPAAPPARVQGIVLDGATGRPLAGGQIRLTSILSGQVSALLLEGDGSFAFPSLVAGTYEVRARGMGYAPGVDTLSLSGGDDRFVTLTLAPAPFELKPLVVSADRWDSTRLRDFERRKALGFGWFVTRDDIEERRPLLVTDLLRGLGGIRVVHDRMGDAHLVVRGLCRPRLYVDGVAAFEGLSLDTSFLPDDVEGIEVYSAATVPAQYARNACGAVLVWTRVPRRGEGGASWRTRLAVAGVFLGLVLITR